MVCEKVVKMAQMRPDDLANALRMVVSACSCCSAAGARHRALAGENGMVERQRHGSIVAVLPRREHTAVDAVFMHVSETSHAAQAARQAGLTAAGAEQTKRTVSWKDELHLLSSLYRLQKRHGQGAVGRAGAWDRRWSGL